MGTVRAVVTVLVVLSGIAGGLAAAGPLGSSLVADEAGGNVAADRGEPIAAQTNGTDDGSLGHEVASFMQITAAGAEGAVDSGMWLAAYNSTTSREERVRLITDRIEYLQQWADQLESERAALEPDRNNTSVSYVARSSRLATRIESFQTAVSRTSTLANETGTGESEMRQLRNESANLSETGIPAVDEQLATETAPAGTAATNATTTITTPTANETTTTANATEAPTTEPTTATPEPTTTETPEPTPTDDDAADGTNETDTEDRGGEKDSSTTNPSSTQSATEAGSSTEAAATTVTTNATAAGATPAVG